MSKSINRRGLLQLTAGAVATSTLPLSFGRALAADAFKLPPLGYAFGALEPHIDARTMEIHHGKHHAAYVANINKVAATHPDIAKRDMAAVLGDLASVPEAVRTTVRNNLGGHFNHTLFWDLMTPGGATAPAGDLKSAIDGAFGNVDAMKAAVNDAAGKRFGSGWAWLAVGKDRKLTVLSTANQDTTHMHDGAKPVLGVDVWEHAYYLKYQNRRADYVKSWWNTVNWDKAAANFRKATG